MINLAFRFCNQVVLVSYEPDDPEPLQQVELVVRGEPHDITLMAMNFHGVFLALAKEAYAEMMKN